MSLAKIALPAFAGVLVVGAVVVTLWMIGSASGERAKFSSLEIAPKEADAFFAINTDPTSPQWLAVNDSLGALGAKDPIREAIDEALAEVNLDWEDDILPVAGDEAFFSVPSFDDVDGSSGFVAGFRIADEDKARDVFDDLRERAADEGEELQEEEYEGVTIYYGVETGVEYFSFAPMYCTPTWQGEGCVCSDDGGPYSADRDENNQWQCEDRAARGETPAGAVALFDEVLAIGGSTDDVKSVIDVVQGRAPSAVENERLQEFRELQKDDFLMWGYADLATVWDIAEAGAATTIGGPGGEEPFETEEPTRRPQPTETPVPSETPAPETDFSIPSFDSEVVVGLDGSLRVLERIEVNFGTVEKHGIFRSIETQAPYDFENDELLEINFVSVTRDGVEEPYEMTTELGFPTVIKIGDPNATVTGAHEYEISYTVFGGIAQYIAGEDGIYDISWNATGTNWGVPIGHASATVSITSGTILTATCNVGPDPTSLFAFPEGCSGGAPADRSTLVEADGELEPGTGLGVRVTVEGESGAPPPVLVPSAEFPLDFFDEEVPEDPFPFDINTEELFEQLRGTYERVGFAVSSTSEGFAFDVTVLHAEGLDPELAFEPAAVFDSHFAESVPAETMFFFAGYDIYGQNWLPAREYFEDVEFTDGKTLDDFLDEFADETGVDLEDDILSLLTGEYAVAGDVSDWDDETPDFSVLALLDVADPNKAQTTLDDLGDYLEGQDAVRIDDDDPVQRWTFLDQSELSDALGVTVSDGAVIAGYPDSAVEDAVEGFEASLASTEDWKRTVGFLPEDTTSIGFLSIARILEEARKLDDAEQTFEDATDGDVTFDDLGALRSVGYATTSRENGFGVHFVVFVEDR